MRAVLVLICSLGLPISGLCQPQLANVYHIQHTDGTVSVFGANTGFVPYTVTLTAKLKHMVSSVALPARVIVLPAKQPVLLTTFIPEPRQVPSFQYQSTYQIGAYTGLQPDTSYVYALPFRLQAGDKMPKCSTSNKNVPGNRHPYFFSVAEGTPIRASREGIVASIRQDLKINSGPRANYIIIYHADGSYAWYQNLMKESAAVQIGQQVAAGDLLGNYSGGKQHPGFYFTVDYPGEFYPLALPVVFGINGKPMQFDSGIDSGQN